MVALYKRTNHDNNTQTIDSTSNIRMLKNKRSIDVRFSERRSFRKGSIYIGEIDVGEKYICHEAQQKFDKRISSDSYMWSVVSTDLRLLKTYKISI